jgi:hypothetical protein
MIENSLTVSKASTSDSALSVPNFSLSKGLASSPISFSTECKKLKRVSNYGLNLGFQALLGYFIFNCCLLWIIWMNSFQTRD